MCQLLLRINVRNAEIDLRNAETELRGVETDLRDGEIELRNAEADLRGAEGGLRGAKADLRSAETGLRGAFASKRSYARPRQFAGSRWPRAGIGDHQRKCPDYSDCRIFFPDAAEAPRLERLSRKLGSSRHFAGALA